MAADTGSIITYWGGLCLSLFICAGAQKAEVTSQKKKLIWAALIALPLSLIAGLRYGVGTDYFPYLNKFYTYMQEPFTQCFHVSEPGFFLLVKILLTLGFNQFWVFGMIEFITLFLVSYCLLEKKEQLSIPLGFFIYYLLFYHISLNIMRQCLAVSILLFGIVKLQRDQWKPYIVCFLIAATIHTSAYLGIYFLIIYFIDQKRKTAIMASSGDWWVISVKQLIYYTVIFLSPLFLTSVVNTILKFSAFEKYRHYMHTDRAGFGNEWIINTILLFVPIFVMYWGEIRKNWELRMLTDFMLLHVPLMCFSSMGNWTSRLLLYTQALLVLYLPGLAHNDKKTSNKYLFLGYFLILIIIEYVVKILIRNYSETFPYYSIFG